MKDITYNLDEIIEIIKKITDKNYYVTLEGVNFKLEQYNTPANLDHLTN